MQDMIFSLLVKDTVVNHPACYIFLEISYIILTLQTGKQGKIQDIRKRYNRFSHEERDKLPKVIKA